MGIHIFPKGISPKENVKVLLEFELADDVVAVQYVSHFITNIDLFLALIDITKSILKIFPSDRILVQNQKGNLKEI